MLTRLLSLTLLVASLVGGLLALSAGREYQRLLAEHRRLERKVGNVPISDASQVHVRALKTGEPLHFAWRVYLPAGFHARWDSGRGYSTSSSSSASEFIARVRFQEDDNGILNVFEKHDSGSSRGSYGNRAVADLLRGHWDDIQVEQLGSGGVVAVAEGEIENMQRMARQLIVDDESQITVVKLQETWYDENRWELYLPEGKYVVRLATREIDAQGFPAPVQERHLPAGRQRLELQQTKQESGWTITVTIDGRPWLEVSEQADWQTSGSSSGGSEIGELTQRPPDKPLVLFRRRFHPRNEDGIAIRPDGPCDGLQLWIDTRTD